MFTITIIIALILAALILAQAFLAAGFIACLRRSRVTPLSNDECPKVALIICIRGKDSTLAECLNAALNQDYPDYGVHIIVDSQSDPVWPLVKKMVAANPQTPSTVQMLTNPLHTCSLKCSSLIQAISGLDPSYEVVALLDTDVVSHRCWLRAMVAPLADPKVGASTGNRWFAPYSPSWASLARYAWNAAAVVLMYWLEIAWGGSLAIKRSVIDKGELLVHWSHTYGDDTAINPALRRLGLRIEFVPSALIVARGDCDVSQFLEWVTRQLVSCRLHHRGWRGVVLHGLGTSVMLGLALLVLAAGIFGQRWDVVAPLAGALAAYLVTMMGLLARLDATVTRATPLRPSAGTWTGRRTLWKLLPAILLAQLVYAFGLLKAVFARSVEWRGIHYRIEASGSIRMLEHRTQPDVTRRRASRHPAEAPGA